MNTYVYPLRVPFSLIIFQMITYKDSLIAYYILCILVKTQAYIIEFWFCHDLVNAEWRLTIAGEKLQRMNFTPNRTICLSKASSLLQPRKAWRRDHIHQTTQAQGRLPSSRHHLIPRICIKKVIGEDLWDVLQRYLLPHDCRVV